jgi:transcriptional regulator with XRE-family HTH domain
MRSGKLRRGLTFRQISGLTRTTPQYIEAILSGRVEAPKYKTTVVDSLRKILL